MCSYTYYNSTIRQFECFSKIIDDFEDGVKCTEPGDIQKPFDDVKKLPNFPEKKNRFSYLAELKNDPACYLRALDDIKKIVECADLEEKEDKRLKVNKWLNELPFHLELFYHTAIEDLWRANWQRYTTALKDTGKASPRSKN